MRKDRGEGRKEIGPAKGRKGLPFFKAVSIIFLIVLLLFMTSEILNIATLSQVGDSVKNFFATLTPGKGFPYRINSSSVRKIEILNGNLFILTDGSTLSLDHTAKQVRETEHSFSNPDAALCRGKALVYNRNGNRYRVENRTQLLYSGKTEEKEKIITGAVGRKGNIALATLSDSAASRLSVYDRHFKKKLFVWNCARDSIIAVSLSPNGREAAVSVIGSRGGEIYSKILVFDFGSDKPKAQFEYKNTALIDLKFVSNDNIIAIGDNKAVFIKGLKKQSISDYGTSSLSAYAFSDSGDTVLVLSEYGSNNSDVLQCFAPSLSERFSKRFNGKLKYVQAEGGRLTVLLPDRVSVLNIRNGSLEKEYKADSLAVSAFTSGKNTYLYSIGRLDKCR